MKSHMRNQIDALEFMYENINTKQVALLEGDCFSALKRNNKIIATGLGKNVPICEKFVGMMVSLGLNASCLNTNSAAHGDLGTVKDGDIILVLTKSGNTVESIYLVEQLLKRDVKIWLLTFNKNSILRNSVQNVLCLSIPDEGDKWNLVPNNSSIGYLVFLQAVVLALADLFDVSIDVFRSNHPGGSIGETLREIQNE